LLIEVEQDSCPTRHMIGHTGDGFLRVKRPNQRCESTEGR